MSLMSYEDLVQRDSLWLTKFQTIQYHPGQISLLRQTVYKLEPSLLIYVVAATERVDLDYLAKVLSREKLPVGDIVESGRKIQYGQKGHFTIPIEMRSCPVDAKQSGLFNVRQLLDTLEPMVDRLNQLIFEKNIPNIVIAPVALTKEHEESSRLDIGSFCVQILEPYSLNEYIANLKSRYRTGHLIQHLYHDLALNGARMPSNVVAFLIMYLDRPTGVSHDDLIEYIDWLRKSAMTFNLHLAFTGSSHDVLEFALVALARFIRQDAATGVITVVNFEALAEYASPIVTNVAYYGVISRAILMLHNRNEKNSLRNNLGPSEEIKVMKDDLIELSGDLAASFDTKIPCRPPCKTVQTCINDAFTWMQTCAHYFRIQEARIRQSAGRAWAGDYDSDEEYFMSRRDDPAFKPWVILTQRPYRLDRLNLFMNAVEPFLSAGTVDLSGSVCDSPTV